MKAKDSTPSAFVIHYETRLHYAGLFLLKEMVEKNTIFSAHPDDEESVLEPILHSLEEAAYVKLNRHKEFTVTQKGVKYVYSFLSRYSAFTDEYDVFCGVDLKTKDFAIRYYNSFQDEPEWHAFLREERWEDLRIAIAEYEGFDAIEITFMRFIHDNLFGRYKGVWEYEYLLGAIWDEIQALCNNAIRLKSLSCQSNTQSPESILQELLDRGRKLMQELSQ